MGLGRMLHDFVGVNKHKLKGSLRDTAQTMRSQRDRLRKCDRVRKLRC